MQKSPQENTPVQFIEGCDCGFCGFEFHVGKTFGFLGFGVDRQGKFFEFSVLGEELVQVFFGGGVGEVAEEETRGIDVFWKGWGGA